MTTIEVPTSRDKATSRPIGAEQFEITLYWHGGQAWGAVSGREKYMFKCTGYQYGSYRWKPHLIEVDQALPQMSRQERRQLIVSIRENLEHQTGKKVSGLQVDLFLEPDLL